MLKSFWHIYLYILPIEHLIFIKQPTFFSSVPSSCKLLKPDYLLHVSQKHYTSCCSTFPQWFTSSIRSVLLTFHSFAGWGRGNGHTTSIVLAYHKCSWVTIKVLCRLLLCSLCCPTTLHIQYDLQPKFENESLLLKELWNISAIFRIKSKHTMLASLFLYVTDPYVFSIFSYDCFFSFHSIDKQNYL